MALLPYATAAAVWIVATNSLLSHSLSLPRSHQSCRRRLPPQFMAVSGVESTPNPSSFLLRLDGPIGNLPESISSLRGKTYYAPCGGGGGGECPPTIADVLKVEGVESLYVLPELLTVSKRRDAQWDAVLPPVIEVLGGGSEAVSSLLAIAGMSTSTVAAGEGTPGAAAASSSSTTQEGIRIRMQASNGIPIQVEARGYLGTVRRARLPPRFADAMMILMENDTDGGAFFGGRKWSDRGARYPDTMQAGDGAALDGTDREMLEVEMALMTELEEVEAAYPHERVAAIVAGGMDRVSGAKQFGEDNKEGVVPKLDLESVDLLCDMDADAERNGRGGGGDLRALRTLAAFVASRSGPNAARRNAIAYLGGTAGRGGDPVLDAIVSAFRYEKNPVMRRTAGDAMSDLGDPRVVPAAAAEGLADRSKLVRWRAARVLGELAGVADVVEVLRTAAEEEEAFEVAFELRDALRKVEARVKAVEGGTDAPSAGAGPMWKQIQEGSSSS